MILLIFVMLFSIFSCTQQIPADVINEFFTSLTEFDFVKAGLLLGNKDYYKNVISAAENNNADKYDQLQSLYFINFIYSNISWEITDSYHTEDSSVYKCKINAYNAKDVLGKVYSDTTKIINTSAYLNATAEEKYELLCIGLEESYQEMPATLSKTETVIDITVNVKDGDYYIVPSEELSLAIGGNIN